MDSRRRRSLAIVAFLLLLSREAGAQLAAGDTDFWLAPPDVTDTLGSTPLFLSLVGSDAVASVTIDVPANGSFVPIVVQVPVRGERRVDLTAFRAQLETRPTNTVGNSGLHVVSTAPVTAAYEVASANNRETWQLHGATALGQEFFVPLHKHAPFFNETVAAPHQALATFDIVATQQNTLVTMYSPTPVDGHPALQQFSVSLNRGQTYSGGYSGANATQPSTHPSGAIVVADKPIAISIKDDAVHNPGGSCVDLTGAQLVPVGALGTQFVVPKGLLNGSADESFFITATENNTQVFRGASLVATLFAGEYFRIDLDALPATFGGLRIVTSRPVYASHLTGIGCEAALALLPPTDLAGSRVVDITRTSADEFHLIVVARLAAVGLFGVSGAGTATLPASAFKPVQDGPGWQVARVQLDATQFPVGTTLRIENSSERFLAAQITGAGNTGASYDWTTQYNAPAGFSPEFTTTPTRLPEPGGLVAFNIRVINTGVAPAELLALQDSTVGSLDGIGTCDVPVTIPGGGFYSCSYGSNVAGNAGASPQRTVQASGVSRDVAIQAQDTLTVPIDDVLPTIAVSATAAPTAVEPGDTVTFTVRIQNAGTAEPVTVTALSDNVVGSLAGIGSCVTSVVLAPGTSSACTYTAIATGATGTQFARTIAASASDDETNIATSTNSASALIGTSVFANGFEG